MVPVSHDDVVVELDVEDPAHLGEAAGQTDVLLGGPDVAGGVVVDEDHGAGIAEDAVLDDLPGIDDGLVNSAHLNGDAVQLVAGIEIEDQELLHVGILERPGKLHDLLRSRKVGPAVGKVLLPDQLRIQPHGVSHDPLSFLPLSPAGRGFRLTPEGEIDGLRLVVVVVADDLAVGAEIMLMRLDPEPCAGRLRPQGCPDQFDEPPALGCVALVKIVLADLRAGLLTGSRADIDVIPHVSASSFSAPTSDGACGLTGPGGPARHR